MKTYILVLMACFQSVVSISQSLLGAWETTLPIAGQNPQMELKNVVIFSESHQVSAIYDAQTGAFITTNGGSWSVEGNSVTTLVEFDTNIPERVGTLVTFEVEVSGDELKIKGKNLVWKRIDDGSPGKLAGAWLISGRKRNGEIQQRDTNRPRKTMKILSGTRFQWIAYNTQTKAFMGTGGGTYTTIGDKYTENIAFFSRDNSRVGASLGFNFGLKNGDWHHSGLGSKGQPIYEIWTKR